MGCKDGCFICDENFRENIVKKNVKLVAFSMLSVVVSVCLTLTNNMIMRSGTVHPTTLVLAHASCSLVFKAYATWDELSYNCGIRGVGALTGGAGPLMLMLSSSSYAQVALWNLGIASGSTMADFQLFKLTSPLWSAVVQSVLLDTSLSGVGWAACACSGVGLGLGSGVELRAGGFGKLFASRPFLLAAALQPSSNVLIHTLRRKFELELLHPAWLWGNLIEVFIAVAGLQLQPQGIAETPALTPEVGSLLVLSCVLATVLRWTTVKLSVFDGGPVYYAILSPVKAVLALLVAASFVELDAAALTFRTVVGFLICAASVIVFYLAGTRPPVDEPQAKKKKVQ